MSERTYLELSEDAGSHKFYEVLVDGKTLTIRYGRIGDAGQTKVSECASPEKARAEAAKKIAEKNRVIDGESITHDNLRQTIKREESK